MTPYALRKLMARATRARTAYDTAQARLRIVYRHYLAAGQRATDAYERWKVLEREINIQKLIRGESPT